MIKPTDDNEYYQLTDPVKLPKASGFLWNETMMIQANCRGYATAQFMQPEPSKYSHAPNLEGTSFMQPEQPYYAHHPGRFVYVKDEDSGNIFSTPYEPVRTPLDRYVFSVGKHDLIWEAEKDGIHLEMKLTLPKEDSLELWTIKVRNTTSYNRMISIYPYYTVGYMSWMNQSGEYHEDLNAIICSSVTPYQKYKDYFTIKNFKDKTFLLSEKAPDSWEVNQEVFEGEGGITNPDGIQGEYLARSDSRYEMPVAVMQYQLKMSPNEEQTFRFIFGPAKDETEIAALQKKYFIDRNTKGYNGFEAAILEYQDYIKQGEGCIEIHTPDKDLDNFVNHWLPRQMYYHGITNRLTTDPQTRNYLQDNMGMSYMKPKVARDAFLLALSQQNKNGSMPDGIKLHEDAELKYINQVPHSDHCVWLSICLNAYLEETDDYDILDEMVPFEDGFEDASVFEHINRGMNWLINDRDERGLNYIRQGDWCDPMNMVGYKGDGVSGWLTIATAYALMTWANICEHFGQASYARIFKKEAEQINQIINIYLWDGDWYARGITDDNITFGISTDVEGRIFLNPQGWALLSGAANEVQKQKLMKAVKEQLETPYGVEKLAPSYTSMREDVGRVTQKFPGSAENGAVYNHAAAFYIYALYKIGEKEDAYRLLRKMLPGPDMNDILQRGQLPVFIPNYYRGAYHQIPRTAGRSSHLFNTGTISWYYRCLIDGLFGLKGSMEGLIVNPQLPTEWSSVRVKRIFRRASFDIKILRKENIEENELFVDGKPIDGNVIRNISTGSSYKVLLYIPS